MSKRYGTSADERLERGEPPSPKPPRRRRMNKWVRRRFKKMYLFSVDTALVVAAKIVEPDDVEDIVQSAVLRMIYVLEEAADPMAVMDSWNRFRASFCRIVKNLALDYKRGREPKELPEQLPAAPHEPEMAGRHCLDRPLHRVFEHYDEAYEGVEVAPAHVARPPVQRKAHYWPPEDRSDVKLRIASTVWAAVRTLPEKQRAVVFYLLEGYDRDQIAKILGISLKTFDTHRQRAFAALRNKLSRPSFVDDTGFEYHRLREIDRLEDAYRRKQAERALTRERRKAA